MSQVIDLEKNRLRLAAKKGFRNWETYFKESFGPETTISLLSLKTLSFLAQGGEKGTFYLYDLIMNLRGFGSGIQFNALASWKKMVVIDQYIFLLDRIRFECMKRAGWLLSYPGEERPLAEMILNFEKMAPQLQARIPDLNPSHPEYETYSKMNIYDKEVLIRKLIPKVLELFPVGLNK